jgi:hypothetical protein
MPPTIQPRTLDQATMPLRQLVARRPRRLEVIPEHDPAPGNVRVSHEAKPYGRYPSNNSYVGRDPGRAARPCAPPGGV